MRVLHPELASWLLGLPIAFGAWYLHVYAKRRFRERAAIGSHLQGLSRLSTATRDRINLAAAVLTLLFLTIAVMRPQLMLERRTPDLERADLIVVLDRSASMQARDVPPSRFARAVTEIRTFLTRKPDGIDRVGLVGFAGTSLIISHFTRDLSSLFFYLDWIQEDTETRFGTDIGAALASARELARKDGRPTRKIVLLLSDGDDQGTELPDELLALRATHTRVYTIGIGSDRDVPIPVAGQSGVAAYLYDENGNVMRTRFAEATLRDIAVQTGGRYFRSATGGELAQAIEAAVERERKVIGSTVSTEYRDVYRPCLGVAAAAMLLVLLTL
jgi:Ca-activated chloride channel family protein